MTDDHAMETRVNKMKRKTADDCEKCPQYYKIGDKVEAIQLNTGAWCSADIVDIFPTANCECYGKCHCRFLILFESDDKAQVVERKLDQIRQVTYSSVDWNCLRKGMKVVINYNIKNPGQWGDWFDYVISDIHKRDGIIHIKGTLLVGYDGVTDKIPVEINSDNVLDILEIRPHATVEEKELETYETGVKPEFCKSCKNKPKSKCKKCCCCKCGSKNDFELTVQCDECADWYHTYCLSPPLAELPDDEEDWYCPKCNNESLHVKKEMLRKSKKKKRQKKGMKKRKRKASNDSGAIPEKKRTPEKAAKEPDEVKKEDNKREGDGDEGVMKMRFISKIRKKSSIWNQVEEMFPRYEVRKISVELIDKSEDNKESVLNPTLERLIYADEINEHLWNEARERIKDGKQSFLSHVRKLFTCSICCDLMKEPITLSCKHSFCITCFFKALSVNVYSCALCRADVINTEHYLVNENLTKILELLFKN